MNLSCAHQARMVNGLILLSALTLSSCAWWPGQSLPMDERLNGAATLNAFSRSEESLRRDTAVVRGATNGQLSLAMSAGFPGFWVTKASAIEQSGSLRLKLSGLKSMPARISGVDKESDVALLQVIGTESRARSSWGSTPREGAWVASLRDSDDLRVGIVSGATRRIEVPQTMLGIIMEPDDSQPGALIAEVIKGGMADIAKLREGDRILTINADPIRSYRTLQRVVRALKPGDRVALEYERKGSLRNMSVSLGDETTNEGEKRNLRMSGPVSQRRAGFEQVFQHDCPLGPECMGGPVVDLRGTIVGMNIARRDRVTTFALTIAAVRRALGRINAPQPNL